MPKYTPIIVYPSIKASLSDLIELKLTNSKLQATFIIPGDNSNSLMVQFEKVDIVRILDEMPLSTEEEKTPNEGLLPNHLAYIVAGANFWEHQSSAFRAIKTLSKHFRLITGWTCLDVISSFEPVFTIKPKNSGESIFN